MSASDEHPEGQWQSLPASGLCPYCSKEVRWRPASPRVWCASCRRYIRLSKETYKSETTTESIFENPILTDAMQRASRSWTRIQSARMVYRYVGANATAVVSLAIGFFSVLISPLVLSEGQLAAWWAPLLFVVSVGVLSSLVVVAIGHHSFENLPSTEYARLALEGIPVDQQFRWIALEMKNLLRNFVEDVERTSTQRNRVSRRFHRWRKRQRPNTRRRMKAAIHQLSRRDQRPAPVSATNKPSRTRSDAPFSLLLLQDQLAKAYDDEFVQRHKRGSDPSSERRTDAGILTAVRDLYEGFEADVESALSDLQQTLRNQHKILQRLARMKLVLAESLQVDHRRLCDHIFRFSPAIYERRARKFVENWKAIVDILANADFVPAHRLLELLRENKRIISRMRRRRHYLDLLATFEDLFPYVAVFAGRSSLREALLAYSRAFAQIASDLAAYGRAKGYEREDQWHADPIVDFHRAQLVALTLMQKAHVGVDLQRSLLNLCKNAEIWCKARKNDRSEADPQWKKWKDKKEQWKRRAEMLASLKEWPPKTIREWKTDVDDLKGLAFDALAALHFSQWEINHRAKLRLQQWLNPQMRTLVLTYGFSRTVRDVIKVALFGSEIKADVFVGQIEGAELEARIMEFELREDRDWFSPSNDSLGFGDEELVRTLIQDENLKVLVLLGAQCFDTHRRVVNAAGPQKRLRELRKSFTDALPPSERTREKVSERFLIAAVAPSYRHYPDLSKVAELFRDDLDKIALYEPGFIDLIISDSLVEDLPARL